MGFAARLAVTMFPFFLNGDCFCGGKPSTALGRRNMLGFKSWWRRVRGGQSEQQQAEAEVLAVQQEVGTVQRSIMDQIAQLKQEQLVLRAELQEQVRIPGVSRSALAGTTKKLKQTERKIAEKEKLCANVAREHTQLADTSTNTQVASAMMRSVEAQQKLQKLDLGGVCLHVWCEAGSPGRCFCTGRSLDDVVDEIEDNREDTREYFEFTNATVHDPLDVGSRIGWLTSVETIWRCDTGVHLFSLLTTFPRVRISSTRIMLRRTTLRVPLVTEPKARTTYLLGKSRHSSPRRWGCRIRELWQEPSQLGRRMELTTPSPFRCPQSQATERRPNVPGSSSPSEDACGCRGRCFYF